MTIIENMLDWIRSQITEASAHERMSLSARLGAKGKTASPLDGFAVPVDSFCGQEWYARGARLLVLPSRLGLRVGLDGKGLATSWGDDVPDILIERAESGFRIFFHPNGVGDAELRVDISDAGDINAISENSPRWK